MLTILHDRLDFAGRTIEVASAEGIEIIAPARATCRLATVLMELGYDAGEPVRLVRADPLFHGPPHRISDIRLSLAAKVDFFGQATGTNGQIPVVLGR